MSLLLKEKQRALSETDSESSFSDTIKLFSNIEISYPNEIFVGLLGSDIKVSKNLILDKYGGYLDMISSSERKKLFPVYYKVKSLPDNEDAILSLPYHVKNDHTKRNSTTVEERISKNIASKNLLYIKGKTFGNIKKAKKSPLSNEFKVATEIYRCELEGKLVWYTKLVSLLKSEMSKNTVTKALNVLFDWGIVKMDYGETENGRPGKLLRITADSKTTIKDLYNKYWNECRLD